VREDIFRAFEARATKQRVLHLRDVRIRLLASKFVQYFLKRTLCLICRIPLVNTMALVYAIAKVSIELIAIYFQSFEIFIIQLGEMAFCKPVYYYQVKLFSECSKRRMLFG
jgi:hypothetical protein